MTSNDSFDAFVIGAGPAGEAAVSRLVDQGLHVGLAERELIGGECAYWACIPSKSLLRPPEIQSQARHGYGVEVPTLNWDRAREYRDYMVRDLDDLAQVEDYQDKRVTVFKQPARFDGPGRVSIGDSSIKAQRVLIATGSEAEIPPINGIESVPYWTNREATTFEQVPRSVIVLGGGPVGIELAQMFCRYGSKVTLVESADRLLAREDEAVGELIASQLASEQIEVMIGTNVDSFQADGAGVSAELATGETVAAERLVVATGRKPRSRGLGLDSVGIDVAEAGAIAVDERCRAEENIWAIGDVTGELPFTHVGKYQARIACADIAGEPVKADYSAVPRVVFSDPEIAAVGLTESRATEQGVELKPIRLQLGDEIAKPALHEKGGEGRLCLHIDQKKRVVAGAWAVAPLASEWIHVAALAIKAQVPIETLADFVPQFPTFSEGYQPAFERSNAQ